MNGEIKAKAKTNVLILAVMIMIAITASAIAPTAASFSLIEGNVTFCNGTAAIDPAVTIKNMNAGMVFDEDVSLPGDNYYMVHVYYEAGHILCFNASKGDNRNIFNHTATPADVANIGFVQDINITICGDANCEGSVNWADIVSLRQRVYHGATLNCCEGCP